MNLTNNETYRLQELMAHCEQRNMDEKEIPEFLADFGRVTAEQAKHFLDSTTEEGRAEFRRVNFGWHTQT